MSKPLLLTYNDELIGFRSSMADVTTVTPAAQLAAKLFSMAYGYDVIEKLTGIKESTLRPYKTQAWFKDIMSKHQAEIEDDLKKLYFKRIQVIKDAMEYPDPQIKLAACNLYDKMGLGPKKEDLSAEDVVKHLIEEKPDGSNVNGEEGKSSISRDALNRETLLHSE